MECILSIQRRRGGRSGCHYHLRVFSCGSTGSREDQITQSRTCATDSVPRRRRHSEITRAADKRVQRYIEAEAVIEIRPLIATITEHKIPACGG